ncbi:MAG TPA: hypothetical protein VK069_01885 [Mycolicibacillus parakoreensis]|nr:hypothetical protein [Mycolicibacillus parakoreensis]
MARHHNYSKRSRESRKAMTDSATDPPDYSDFEDTALDDWRAPSGDPDTPPGRAD